MRRCSGCGAIYPSDADSCAAHFDALLALDHSRQEPWGSRHGLAFAAFTLQHPDRHPRVVLERSWHFLQSVFVKGISAERVAQGLRRVGNRRSTWDVRAFSSRVPGPRFAVTIADLGAFDAETYPAQLDAWCVATLDAWRGEQPA